LSGGRLSVIVDTPASWLTRIELKVICRSP
jgi:hypothetical protein